MLYSYIQNVFKEEAVLKGQKRTKNQKGIGIKSIYSNTSNCFEYKEICISKLFIIMFIKWKNRAGKVYA